MADGSVIIDTKMDTSGVDRGVDDISNSVKNMLGYMQSLSTNVEKIVNLLTNGSTAASNAVSNLTDNLEATADAGKRAVNAVKKFDPSDVSGLTIHRWNDDSNLIGDTSEITPEQSRELAESARATRQAAQAAADAFNGEKEKVNELYEAIKKTKEELKSLEKSGKFWGDDEYDEAAIKLRELNQQVEEYKRKTLSPEIEETTTSINRMGESLGRLSQKLMASGIADLKRTINGIAKSVDRLMKKLLRLSGAAIISGVKKLSSGIFSIHKSANKSTMTIGKMLKTILKYSVGIRSLYVLFNRLRSAIVSGFENLAQYDPSGKVNQSISSLKSSLTQLKNSFATAFAPILTTVAPALTRFINLISEAVTRVGMLIAAFTGQKTFTKAIGVQEDYAASLDKTADSANNAAKAINGYLSPLDEITRYESNKSDSGSGSSGGHTGPSASDMFEEVPIESSLKGIADKIKKLIKEEDWEGLGSYMADGINTGLQKVYDAINWDNVGPKITPFITGFTATFNSLVDNINWVLLGNTVGAGINTIVNALNLAITGIDWYNLGKKFAKGIKGIVNEVNWNNLGQLIGNKFMIAWKVFKGFVEDLPYKKIGNAVANGLNGVFSTISFSDVASALVTAINGAFTSLKEFVRTFNWDKFAENVKNGITTFVNGINWKENGVAFGEFLSKLCDTITNSITSDTFYDLGKGIGDFLAGLPWGKLLNTAAKMIINGLAGALSGLWESSLAGKITAGIIVAFGAVKLWRLLAPIRILVGWIVGKISAYMMASGTTSVIANSVGNMLTTSLSGATSAMGTFAASIGPVLGTAGIVATATVVAVNCARGIASITEAAQGGNGILSQAGGYLHDYTGEMESAHKITQEQAEELWKLIEAEESAGKSNSEMYDSFVQKLSEYGVSAENARKILEQYGAQAGVSSGFVEEMTNKVTALGDGMSQTDGKIDTSKVSLNDLKDIMYQLSLKSDDFGSSYTTVLNQLKDPENNISTAKEGFDLIYNSLKDMGIPLDEFDKMMKEQFPEAVTTAETTTKTSMGNVKKAVETASGAASASIATATASIKTDTQKNLGMTSTAVNTAMTAVQTAAETSMKKAQKSVESSTGEISRTSDRDWSAVKGFVSGAMDNIESKAKSKMSAVLEVIKEYNGYVLTDFKEKWGESETTVVSAIQNMIEQINTNSSILASGVENAFSGIPDYISDIMNNAVGKVNSAIGRINGALNGVERSFTFTYNYTNPITKNKGTYRSWLNLPRVNTVPYLASGAVIPPRSEFLAVLGDQKNGRNLEAPEGVIRDIINDAFNQHQQGSGGTFKFIAQLERKTIFEKVIEEAKLIRDTTGENPFEMN
jgi:hypothetical protein